MKSKSFAGMRCSIAGAVELIGDRWSFLLIRDLFFGLSRYDDFRASTGIPAATLAARLKHLEASGIIARVQYQERPPRDEYRLTAKGRDLWKVSLALREWGDRWDASGFGAPPDKGERMPSASITKSKCCATPLTIISRELTASIVTPACHFAPR